MEYILISGISVIIGSVISNVIFYRQSAFGVLKIDHSDPEKDVYRLEVDDLDSLKSKKRVIVSIDNEADLSRN